ncbi:MAG: hypothetical protein QG597_2640 [Actinomycetota bacterium]|nr:hypothetical protein [Actinomycetota bacterium]
MIFVVGWPCTAGRCLPERQGQHGQTEDRPISGLMRATLSRRRLCVGAAE